VLAAFFNGFTPKPGGFLRVLPRCLNPAAKPDHCASNGIHVTELYCGVCCVLADDADYHATAAVAGLCLWGWTWGWGGGWGCEGWSTFDYGPVCGAGLLDQVASYGVDACYDVGAYDVAAYDGGGACDVAGFEICDAGAVDAVGSAFDVGFFF